MERKIPLEERKGDIVILVFFWINILFITYIVDVEQNVLPDISGDWEYPIWPPPPAIDLIHWYGHHFDPVLIARPMWWRMTIWVDSIFYGPFYVFAIYAFTKGKNWIRMPAVIYGGSIITIVLIILGEEFFGGHPTPHPGLVFLLNLPWIAIPAYVIYRMWGSEKPFTKEVDEPRQKSDRPGASSASPAPAPAE